MSDENPEAEPSFSQDVESMDASVNRALNELTDVRAYTLNHDELRAFKAAQYALRVLSEDRDTVMNRDKLEALFDD